MILNVVTPEKSVVRGLEVEAVVLPGEAGQMTVLPGHVNIVSALTHGSFAYKEKGQWSWAFLESGFAQICEQKLTVLAETVEFIHEVDIAAAELELQELVTKSKNIAVGNPEYPAQQKLLERARVRLDTLKKSSH